MSFEIELQNILANDDLKKEESMKEHTTLKVGGPAKYFVSPKNTTELAAVLNLCKDYQVPWFLLGKGSNLLVSDCGYDGVVIHLEKYFSDLSCEGNLIKAGSGAALTALSRFAWQEGLGGLEFAAGIPGSVGGAVVMNAGAYGGEVKDVILEATVMTVEGKIEVLSKEELQLGYRGSCILPNNYTVLDCTFQLNERSKDDIKKDMDYYNEQRRLKQPLDKGSAGSTFKRPKGYFAGQLIQEAGLRGYKYGGAAVSDKHCGFVVNMGEATATDVWNLIQHVRKTVKENSGVSLEMEVKTLGDFNEG